MISIKKLQLLKNRLHISNLDDDIIKEDIFVQIIDKERVIKFSVVGLTKDYLLILTVINFCKTCLCNRIPSWKRGCALLRKVPLTDIIINKSKKQIVINQNRENKRLYLLILPNLPGFVWYEWCDFLHAFKMEFSKPLRDSYKIIHGVSKYLQVYSYFDYEKIKSYSRLNDDDKERKIIPINRFGQNINENCIFTLYLPDPTVPDISDQLFFLSLHSSCITFPLNGIKPVPILDIGTSLLIKRTTCELTHLRKCNSEVKMSESFNLRSYVYASLEDLTPSFIERKYYLSPNLNSSFDIWMFDENPLLSFIGYSSNRLSRRLMYKDRIKIMRMHFINSTSKQWTREKIQSIQYKINKAIKLIYSCIQSKLEKNIYLKNNKILHLAWINEIDENVLFKKRYELTKSSTSVNQSLQILDMPTKLLANEITLIDTNLFLSLRAEELARLIFKPSSVNSVTISKFLKL
ncbi:uncharacterized protein LOC111620160 isoform X2 [Centruroides sculpturatus]|nr:uncharacterized protein LOC111620160 isoform X2 [Centruroides sculpturatus]